MAPKKKMINISRMNTFPKCIVVICTNIEPRKIGNIISNGMLLAADGSNGKPIFLTINEEAPIGANIH